MRYSNHARTTRLGRHTSCIKCGELVFDKTLSQCPRCKGPVSYFSDADLTFLGRVAARPMTVIVEDEETRPGVSAARRKAGRRSGCK